MNTEIQESLSKAQAHVSNLRKTNSRFIYISLIASVFATLIAGLTAFSGPIVGQDRLPGNGPVELLLYLLRLQQYLQGFISSLPSQSDWQKLLNV